MPGGVGMTKVRLSIFQTSGKKRKHLFVTEIGGWVWKKIVFQNRPRKVYKRVERGKRKGIAGEGIGREQSKETFPSNTRDQGNL